MVNVIFSEALVSGILKWNDKRDRSDYETGVGGKMERWFVDVRKAMYEARQPHVDDSISSDDDSDGAVDFFGQVDWFVGHVDEETIKRHIDDHVPDPSNYLTANAKTLGEWVTKLIKCRKVVMENMKKSGEHDHDIYNYMEVALKKTQNLKLLGTFPLYYFCLKASLCPDFDKHFQPFMSDDLKGDSTGILEDMSVITENSRKKKRAVEVDGITASMQAIEQSQTLLARQHQINAKLVEYNYLQGIIKNRNSPLNPRMKARLERKMEAIMESLYPEEDDDLE